MGFLDMVFVFLIILTLSGGESGKVISAREAFNQPNHVNEPSQPHKQPDSHYQHRQSYRQHSQPYRQPDIQHSQPYRADNQHSQPYRQTDSQHSQPYRQSDNQHSQPYRQPASQHSQSDRQPDNLHRQPDQQHSQPYRQPDNPHRQPDSQHSQLYRQLNNQHRQPDNPHSQPYRQTDSQHSQPYRQPDNPHSQPYRQTDSQHSQPDSQPYRQPDSQPNDSPNPQLVPHQRVISSCNCTELTHSNVTRICNCSASRKYSNMGDNIKVMYPEVRYSNELPTYFGSTTSTVVTVAKDATAYLKCHVINLGTKSVSWVRERDLHVLTVGRQQYTSDDRYRASSKPGSNVWVLHLRYAQPKDSGHYECQVSTNPPTSRTVTLDVIEPQATIQSGSDLFVDPGSPFNITCVILNNPEPPDHVFWYHKRKMVGSDWRKGVDITVNQGPKYTYSMLFFRHITPEDAGVYTCAPYHMKEASVTVRVLGDELPQVMETGGSSRQRVNNTLILLTSFLLIILIFPIPMSLFLSSYSYDPISMILFL